MRLYNLVDKKVLREKLANSAVERLTLSFYQYAKIEQPQQFRDELYAQWMKWFVFGRVYVSNEGINAQISLPKERFEAFRTHLYSYPYLNNIRLNIAVEDDGKSFYKLKIKVKEKIVADGLNDKTFDVTNGGVHVDAEQFNQLADDPNTVIIDMRNHYESEIGHFKNAVTPDVETFRESLPLIKDMLEEDKDKNLLMYCTGGIRCEKASAYFKHKGFEKVYQLDGGIIEYTRQVNQKGLDNKFVGKNFVFDERMAEAITEDVISKCHQCGEPCDSHINCNNDACHLLFIQCPSCAARFNACCSSECKDFIELPLEAQKELRKTTLFNGTTSSKNRVSLNKLFVGK